MMESAAAGSSSNPAASPNTNHNSTNSNTLPVPAQPSSSRNMHRPELQAGPSSYRFGASPSFGGGMSIDKPFGKSIRMSGLSGAGMSMSGNNGAPPGSYGARFYNIPSESPGYPSFSTSVNMDGPGTSFVASSAAFGFPGASMSSSYRRSYAAAARGDRDFNPDGLSSSFASMSFRPGGSLGMGGMGMSFGGNSYSKSQVHSLMSNAQRSSGGARTDAELTRTYECCGETHKGLHELLEHVEDVHPFDDAMDGNGGAALAQQGYHAYPQPGMGAGQTSTQIGFSPQVLAMDLELEQPELSGLGTIGEESQPSAHGGSQRSSMSPIAVPSLPSYPVPKSGTNSKAPTPPGENPMSPPPLQMSDILTSPFADSLLASSKSPSASGIASAFAAANANAAARSKSASASSSPPDGSIRTPTISAQPSPVFTVPKVTPARVGGFLGTAARPPTNRFDRAFNEVVAGNHGGASGSGNGVKTENNQPTAVAPGMLFASAVAGLGIPTAPPGQTPAAKPDGAAAAPAQDGTADAAPTGGAVPGTDATASGANGAGTMNPNSSANMGNMGGMSGMMGIGGTGELPQPSLFTTHKPWRCPNPGCNKAYKQSNGLKYHQQKGQCDFAIHDAVDLGLSLEEAEERSRPFVCAVGAGCTKRYRQMNGLKYHYLNSGEHGKYGLRMLQNGTHPQPSGVAALAKKPTPSNTPSRPTGAPYQIPSQLGQTRPAGHIASAASNGPGGGAGGANGVGAGAGGIARPAGFGLPNSNNNGNGSHTVTNGAGGLNGQHGLPRMGVFPSNNANVGNQNRPVPGSGPSPAQGQNFGRPGAGGPGGVGASGVGVGGFRPGMGGMPIRNGVPGSGSGTNGPGVSAFSRPGGVPGSGQQQGGAPQRPLGLGQHAQNQNQGQGQGQSRPSQPNMAAFPPLRPSASQSPHSNQNQNQPSRSPLQHTTQQHQQQHTNNQSPKSAMVPNEPPVQRGRDAVLFAAVETMDL